MKIYVLGDSISIQYGPYLQSFSQGVFAYSRKEGEEEALLNLDHPTGANGGDSGMVLSFLTSKAANGDIDADLLLLNCGLHDIKTNPQSGTRQVPIDKYRSNLESIVKLISALKPTLVWMRTTPCDETVHNTPSMAFHRFSADCENYNAVADQVMKAQRVPIIDLFTFTKNLGPDIYCDHVHFVEAVRIQQAAFIAGWLNGFQQMQFGPKPDSHPGLSA